MFCQYRIILNKNGHFDNGILTFGNGNCQVAGFGVANESDGKKVVGGVSCNTLAVLVHLAKSLISRP